MRISHVVFDIDGTLLDTKKAVLYSLSETLRQARGQSLPFSRSMRPAAPYTEKGGQPKPLAQTP